MRSEPTTLIEIARPSVPGDLSEPLAVIQASQQSPQAAKERFPDYRLSRLVTSRLDWDEADIAAFDEILGLEPGDPILGPQRPFGPHLHDVISRYGLKTLFSEDGPAAHHHAIRPTGYDFRADEVIADGMEKWRADYRAMPDHRQMLAASIVWLYRGKKDNRWLRRVPCTWHAVDALHAFASMKALRDWAWLMRLYPGW